MCFFIFSFLITPPPSPVRRGPPSRAPSRAGRPSATCPCLCRRPPPNNSCPGRRLPPRHVPPYPGALALRPAHRVIDHGSILMVAFAKKWCRRAGQSRPVCLVMIICWEHVMLTRRNLLYMVNRSNFCTGISENEQMVSMYSILCYNK
jgi:hypothetical protein